MSKITLGGVPTVEVELFDVLYALVPATRSIIEKAKPIDAAIEAAEDPEAYVEAVLKGIDLRTRPVVHGSSKASTVLRKAWREDKLTIPQLDALLEDFAAHSRPT
jgi:hypothetical protein